MYRLMIQAWEHSRCIRSDRGSVLVQRLIDKEEI